MNVATKKVWSNQEKAIIETLSTRTGDDDGDLKSTPRLKRVRPPAMLVFHFKQINVTGLPTILIKCKIHEWRHSKL